MNKSPKRITRLKKPDLRPNQNHPVPAQKPTEISSTELVRINKYLAHQGLTTRRGADELISKGLVMINDRVAQLGDKVSSSDKVEILQGRGKRASTPELYYYVYNKPAGENVGSQKDGKRFYAELRGNNLFSADQLDKRDSGLIIITNDGRVTSRLLSQDNPVEKEFEVMTRNHLRENFKEKAQSGLIIDGQAFDPKKIKVIDNKIFSIVVDKQGRHEIQSMLSILFNDIVELKRVRIANLWLGKMAAGTFRAIEDEEKDQFLEDLNIR